MKSLPSFTCLLTSALLLSIVSADTGPLEVSALQRKNATEVLAHKAGQAFIKELKSQGYKLEDFDLGALAKGFLIGSKGEASSVSQEDFTVAISRVPQLGRH